MQPLACTNCCHNPLQLGPIGTPVGFCTRHQLTLLAPQHTTCGQLLRKDLLRERAIEERAIHQKQFSPRHVVIVETGGRALDRETIERPNGLLAPDPVADEVTSFATIEPKIATLAALRRIGGVRAEVAFLSLSRGYFENCVRHKGQWTSGLHIAWWTLGRLTENAEPALTELREPVHSSLATFQDLARWYVVMLRLTLLADISSEAAAAKDRFGQLRSVLQEIVISSRAGAGTDLLLKVRQKERRLKSALPLPRYKELGVRLHRRQRAAPGED